MRTPLVTTFYDTLGYCFSAALTDILGTSVRDSVYDLLRRNGITGDNIPNDFDRVVDVMTKTLGSCSRVIVYRTAVEMYKQYSQLFEFSYRDSLRDQLLLLKESVVANHLMPRKLQDETAAYYDTVKLKAFGS